MNQKTIRTAAAVLALCGAAMSASASTATATFTVTATVVNDCSITTTNIAFGNYDPTSATALTAQGAVSTKCTMGDVVSVALNQGLNPGTGSTAAVPARQMATPGTSYLPYHIYTTSGGSTEWGAGVVGTNTPPAQTSVSVNTALVFTTYGTILAGVNVPAGSYTDTVTATVTF
jgi:spore coat protein U-like protein